MQSKTGFLKKHLLPIFATNNDYLVSFLTPGSWLAKAAGSSECFFLWQIYKHRRWLLREQGCSGTASGWALDARRLACSALFPIPREGKCTENHCQLFNQPSLEEPPKARTEQIGLLNTREVLRGWQTVRQRGRPAPWAASPPCLFPSRSLYIKE